MCHCHCKTAAQKEFRPVSPSPPQARKPLLPKPVNPNEREKNTPEDAHAQISFQPEPATSRLRGSGRLQCARGHRSHEYLYRCSSLAFPDTSIQSILYLKPCHNYEAHICWFRIFRSATDPLYSYLGPINLKGQLPQSSG